MTTTSRFKVWVLSNYTLDSAGEVHKELKEIYSEKPSLEQLQERFKGYRFRPNFLEDLLEKGEAYDKNYNYDSWYFELEEVECT